MRLTFHVHTSLPLHRAKRQATFGPGIAPEQKRELNCPTFWRSCRAREMVNRRNHHFDERRFRRTDAGRECVFARRGGPKTLSREVHVSVEPVLEGTGFSPAAARLKALTRAGPWHSSSCGPHEDEWRALGESNPSCKIENQERPAEINDLP